ncbi:MAG TPA: DNA cytosine methyltransferase [Bacteriovoracaceae bacterium]|nr:DNA cytosine methyltransferase [Bacteriovoracaceae bacterium]
MIEAVDLFCGAGGLTKGLENAGINVSLGIDIDPICAYPYEANNKAKFLLKSVDQVQASELFNKKLKGYKLLAGCAPCQPFSGYRRGIESKSDKRWKLLHEFRRLIEETQPDFVTMENVPRVQEEKVFRDFLRSLNKLGYSTSYQVVNCADYGVPQQRNRLVLLASKHGEISLIAPTHKSSKYKTVRDVLEELDPIKAGESLEKDPLHLSASLSPMNLKRIKSSKQGGTWRDWNKNLVAKCHQRSTGKTYASVYGRMSWDKPSPTITTQFFGFGNGRFGHPVQHRAISIREGAILQSFPKGYKFIKKGEEIQMKHIGRLIGNAVPVKLGEVIGKSINQHIKEIKRAK